MNKKIEKAINEQINKELYSSYLYLAMAAFADAKALSGFANWFKMQAQEEIDHAMKFYNYIVSRGGRVTLEAIDKPQADFKTILGACEKTLSHEKVVTASINSLLELARKEKDYAFESMLGWYIDEQVEEEEHAMELVDKVKILGEKSAHIYLLDKELAARTFSASASVSAEE